MALTQTLSEQEFPALSLAGQELLNGLLTYDPARRLTARQALRHDYFRQLPLPLEPDSMPAFPSAHNLLPSSRHAARCTFAAELLKCTALPSAPTLPPATPQSHLCS